MKIKSYPTEFVIEDEDNEQLAVIKMFDSTVANVEVKNLFNVASWKELSKEIENCLILMDLEK